MSSDDLRDIAQQARNLKRTTTAPDTTERRRAEIRQQIAELEVDEILLDLEDKLKVAAAEAKESLFKVLELQSTDYKRHVSSRDYLRVKDLIGRGKILYERLKAMNYDVDVETWPDGIGVRDYHYIIVRW